MHSVWYYRYNIVEDDNNNQMDTTMGLRVLFYVYYYYVDYSHFVHRDCERGISMHCAVMHRSLWRQNNAWRETWAKLNRQTGCCLSYCKWYRSCFCFILYIKKNTFCALAPATQCFNDYQPLGAALQWYFYPFIYAVLFSNREKYNRRIHVHYIVRTYERICLKNLFLLGGMLSNYTSLTIEIIIIA